jgi:hypothetical protein
MSFSETTFFYKATTLRTQLEAKATQPENGTVVEILSPKSTLKNDQVGLSPLALFATALASTSENIHGV